MDELIPYLGLLAVPAGLLVLYGVFRWRYVVAVKRAMAAPSQLEPAAPPTVSVISAPLHITWVDVRDRESASPAVAAAMAATRDVRTRFVAAGTVFMLAASGVVWAGQTSRVSWSGAMALGFFVTLPSLFLMLAFFRLPPRRWFQAAIIWTAVGVALLVTVLNAPWNRVPEGFVSGVLFASFAVPALALVVLRTTRVLLVGFLPMLAVWFGLAGLLALLLQFMGIDAKELEDASRPAVLAWAVLAIVLGFAVAVREIRRGIRRSFVPALLGMLAVSIAIGWYWPNIITALPGGIALNGLLVVAVWFVFARFLRLKERGLLPDEVLHFTACWLTLTALLPLYTVSGASAFPWWIVPIAAYAVVLAVLLGQVRRRGRGSRPKRLLLLRVFNHGALRARLLDLLDDSWRRVGTVDVVVGVDLAARTLSAAALENFLLGRVDRQFLHSANAADRCLATLPRQLAADGRYPLNELHCVPGVWQRVVDSLAGEADVVLMDARGFQAANRGVAYELSLLARRVPFERVVLLSDRTTDEGALTAALERSWAQPIQILRCSGRRSLDAPAIINRMFAALAYA